MNLHNLSFDYVERPREHPDQPNFYPRTPPSSHSQATVRPAGGHQDGGDPEHASSRPASPSTQPTVIPYHTPPTLPSSTTTSGSSSGAYGPARPPQPPAPVAVGTAELAHLRHPPQLTLEDVQRIAAQESMAHGSMARNGFRDELALEASRVTPGVDDTPYIQYALEALTRDRDTGYSQPTTTTTTTTTTTASTGSDLNPVLRNVPGRGVGFYPPPRTPQQQPPPPATPEPVRVRESRHADDERHALAPVPEPASQDPSRASSLDTLVHDTPPKPAPRPIPRDAWRPMEKDLAAKDGPTAQLNPDLTFRPWILRPASMLLLAALCVLMLAALVFAAVYSHARRGLWAFTGTIYGGQYFTMRVLPGLLAAPVLLYAQCVAAAAQRILPFARLASDFKSVRQGALFLDLYPRASFLWPPRPAGPWQVWAPALVTWLAGMTLPLQSCLFTVVLVDGRWRWAAVQGVAWTLAALYLALLAATAVQGRYWRAHRRTGLLWDPRSIADVVALAARGNTLADYRGTELLGTRADLERVLERRRYDRLGYWGWRDGRPGFWYSLGAAWEEEQQQPPPWDDAPRSQEKPPATAGGEAHGGGGGGGGGGGPWDDVRLEGGAHSPSVRYRYLPWCLRTGPLLFFVAAAFVLLLALFVVSFLPATRVAHGFPPGLSALPRPGAFSAADFLYSFLPSLLGTALFLCFQHLELTLRVLQPWAELARRGRAGEGGAAAEASLLADYAARHPLQTTPRALLNGHYRLALVSLLAAALAALPALAGGAFLALTPPDGRVRMYPNLPLYAVVLALLVLYLAGLAALLPRRGDMRLPHGVTCLAEVLSFAGGEDVAADGAFADVRHRAVVRAKLAGGGGGADGEAPEWAFGIGRDGRLGVGRVTRYAGPGSGAAEGSARGSRRERRAQGGQRISPQFVFQSPRR